MSSSNNKTSSPEPFLMNSGNGTYSYSRNSRFQREALVIIKMMIDEAIAEKLDVQSLSSISNSLRIVDLGCSVGPNTFLAMQSLIEAIEKKYEAECLKHGYRLPEFQVFFNDHAANDFNTLFSSLPPGKPYFAAGLPGSFHGRLFPESFLHIVYSSFALQWLSKVPEKVLDKGSPAWNKGRIFYTSASDEVANAYATQFAEDMDNFLKFRAVEVASGGMMFLMVPGVADDCHPSQSGGGWLYDALGSSLMDLANKGLISEAQVDSFNLPVYFASLKEIISSVERNGCFSIVSAKLTDAILGNYDDPINIQAYGLHIRAVVEGSIVKHFGREIIDDLFDRFYRKLTQVAHLHPLTYKQGGQIFVALKRK